MGGSVNESVGSGVSGVGSIVVGSYVGSGVSIVGASVDGAIINWIKEERHAYHFVR